jgi:hypothetical protein
MATIVKQKDNKMNSRQYERMMIEICNETLKNAGINESDYTRVGLSANRTEYEVTLNDGSIVVVPSGFDYVED